MHNTTTRLRTCRSPERSYLEKSAMRETATVPHQKKVEKSRRNVFVVIVLIANPIMLYVAFSRFNKEKETVQMGRSVISLDANEPNNPNDPNDPIKTISLIGEHNSGTTWTFKVLQQCFGELFTIKNRLTRHKHWFQFDDNKKHNQTLVVAQFRDPYQWVLASMEKPRRSPAHSNMDWKTFLTTKWTTEREKSDEKFANETGKVCKERFKYHEIVSCAPEPYPGEYFSKKGSNRSPWYEMRNDGSGMPYDSILDLRRDKIVNHIQTVANFPFVSAVIGVRYEELVRKGTSELIREIESKTGEKAHCEATPGQIRPQRVVPDEMAKWMNERVDWSTEALIGYKSKVLD